MSQKYFKVISKILLLLIFSCNGKIKYGDFDEDSFRLDLWRNPPEEFRPHFRWWWPGGSVEDNELKRELESFVSQGFGGVEIQPFTFGLSEDEIKEDTFIRTVGTDDFFRKVKKTLDIATQLGLTVDLTFGSSWPLGGPFVKYGKARQLIMSHVKIRGGIRYDGNVPKPSKPDFYKLFEIVKNISNSLGPFDENLSLICVVGARIIDDKKIPFKIEKMTDISSFVNNGRILWDVPEGNWFIFAIYENFANQIVFNHAFPGEMTESFVIDHLNKKGIEEMIEGFGNKIVLHLGKYIGTTLKSIFIDSFEFLSELPWTSNFFDRFYYEKGYNLTPYIPLLFKNFGEVKWLEVVLSGNPRFKDDNLENRVREDYEEVRSNLFRDNFLVPLIEWAHKNNLLVRMQNHGGYQDFLEGYSMVDIPETEGLYAGGSYDFMKLASSSAHISGKRFVSSETFVSLTDDPRKLKKDDFFYLAGKAFSAGVNKIYHHGYPYLYFHKDGKRWYPFDASQNSFGMAFTSWSDEDHPVWNNFKEINEYISRVSYSMSRGDNMAVIAWLYPELFFKDSFVIGFKGNNIDSEITKELNNLGLTYDRINSIQLINSEVVNDGFISGKQKYRLLLVNNLKRASIELIIKIKEIADSKIPVIVIGGLPHRSIGFKDFIERDKDVNEISESLYNLITKLDSAKGLSTAMLHHGIKSPLSSEKTPFPFIINHRRVKNGDLFFLFNENSELEKTRITVNMSGSSVLVLDPIKGSTVGSYEILKNFPIEIKGGGSLIIFVRR